MKLPPSRKDPHGEEDGFVDDATVTKDELKQVARANE